MFGYAYRSITAVFTALYLLIASISCSVQEQADTYSPYLVVPDVQQENTPVVVNILQSVPEISQPLQNAVEQYISLGDSGVSIHVQTVPGKEDYRSALRSRLLAGESVDLFHLQDMDDVERLAPYLSDLGGQLPWAWEADTDILDAVTVDGTLHGIPYSLEAIGLIVNRTIFEAAGISLSGVTDFTSLSEAFTELRDQIDAGELKERFPRLEAVTDFSAQDSGYLSTVAAELLLADSFPSPSAARRSQTLSLPAAEAAEKFFSLLARTSPHRGNWNSIPSVTRTHTLEEGLAAERIAAVLESSECIRRINTANPDLQSQLAFIPIYFDEQEQGVFYAGTPVWWAIRADADEGTRTQAGAFLTWLYQSEEGTKYLAEEFGMLTPYRNTTQTTVSTLHSQLWNAFGNDLVRPRIIQGAPSGWAERSFSSQIRQYFSVYDKTWESLTEICITEWGIMPEF